MSNTFKNVVYKAEEKNTLWVVSFTREIEPTADEPGMTIKKIALILAPDREAAYQRFLANFQIDSPHRSEFEVEQVSIRTKDLYGILWYSEDEFDMAAIMISPVAMPDTPEPLQEVDNTLPDEEEIPTVSE